MRWIFRTYLELGSIGRLLSKMDEQNIRSKRREAGDGRGAGGCRFGPGSLGYLLRNRSYVGEISHKGQIHAGTHEAIIDRDLFEAVQTQLKNGAVSRKLETAKSVHLLKGKLFDSAGNRMTPSHSVKKGVRYRYYVSQAILGSRPSETGQVGRVSAPDIEALIEVNLRKRFAGLPGQSLGMADLVEAHLERVVILADAVELRLTDSQKTGGQTERLEWRRQPHSAEKGPVVSAVLDSRPDARATQTVLAAIGKARLWVKEVTDGTTAAEIALREGKSERHIRLLAPLAFVTPRMVGDIVSGTGRPQTVTDLAASVPHIWR